MKRQERIVMTGVICAEGCGTYSGHWLSSDALNLRSSLGLGPRANARNAESVPHP
jgi:hypothetical protein